MRKECPPLWEIRQRRRLTMRPGHSQRVHPPAQHIQITRKLLIRQHVRMILWRQKNRGVVIVDRDSGSLEPHITSGCIVADTMSSRRSSAGTARRILSHHPDSYLITEWPCTTTASNPALLPTAQDLMYIPRKGTDIRNVGMRGPTSVPRDRGRTRRTRRKERRVHAVPIPIIIHPVPEIRLASPRMQELGRSRRWDEQALRSTPRAVRSVMLLLLLRRLQPPVQRPIIKRRKAIRQGLAFVIFKRGCKPRIVP